MKKPTNFRLSDDVDRILSRLAVKAGVTRTEMVEMVVRLVDNDPVLERALTMRAKVDERIGYDGKWSASRLTVDEARYLTGEWRVTKPLSEALDILSRALADKGDTIVYHMANDPTGYACNWDSRIREDWENLDPPSDPQVITEWTREPYPYQRDPDNPVTVPFWELVAIGADDKRGDVVCRVLTTDDWDDLGIN